MKIYCYDPQTMKFLEERDARPDPLSEGEYLIPAFATSIAPPDIAEQQEAVFNGTDWTVTDIPAAPPPPPVPPPPALSDLKLRAKYTINAAAENARLAYITAGSGQAMVYREKVDEARALQTDTYISPDHYPLLSAEIGITASTLQEIAVVVLSRHAAWLNAAASIETIRQKAKKDIDAATDENTVAQIVSAVVWTTP